MQDHEKNVEKMSFGGEAAKAQTCTHDFICGYY
jgi:hypothetical protein